MNTKQLCLLTFLLFALFPLTAQQKKAGIFYFLINVNDTLNKGTYVMTDEWSDVLQEETQLKMEALLQARIDYIYHKTKNGKIVNNGFMFTVNESLPASSFKNAKKNYDRDLYIKIWADLKEKGGAPIRRNGRISSRLSPEMSLTVWVYDKDKKVVYTKKVVNSNFSNMYYELEEAKDERAWIWKLFSPKGNDPNRFEKWEILYMYFKTLAML